jgi:uncharacterized protein (DUF924 family)
LTVSARLLDRTVLREIHRFWFGDLGSPTDLDKDRTAIWYEQSDETDREISERFGRLIPEAATAAWDVAGLSREEGIALVVLLDQFPRNLFRQSREAFAYDAKARAIARALIATGIDRFFFVERVALVLPFEHSEDVADQDYAVMLAAELAVAAPESLRELCRSTLDYATRHRDIIRRFGRFPHRNALLGRASTAAEAAFTETAGRGF